MPRAPMDDVALNQTYAHLVARIVVRPMLGTRVRPNHLTVLRIGIGLLAGALMTPGTARGYLWAGACWIVACVLDRADGELARLGDLRSERGKVLDYYADMILDSAWFLGCGIGLRHGWLGAAAPALGALCCGSMIVVQWSAEMFERLSGPGIKVWYGVRRFHPDDALFLLAPFAWAGPPVLAPILVAASTVLPIVTVVIATRYRKLRRHAAALG